MKKGILPLLAAAMLPLPLSAQHPASDPQPREPQWCLDHHQQLNAKAREGGFSLMLFGDSITWEWEANADTGAAVWPELAPYRPATFGVSGDRTEHLLWRLREGNLETPEPPKAAVLMIGTNNLGQRNDSPQAIADAVGEILTTLRSRYPDCTLYLYAIFPRGATSQTPIRQALVETNTLLETTARAHDTRFIDITSRFLLPDGALDGRFYRDGVHLSAEGYRLWAESLKQTLPTP